MTPPASPDDFPASGPNSLAPIGPRIGARLVDLLIVTIPVILVMLAFVDVVDGEVRLDRVPVWIGLVQVAVAVAYEAVLLGLWGTTVGKWAFGLRVARYADGGRPDVGRGAQRSLLPNMFAAVPLPLVGALQWVVWGSSLTHPLRRGWHDRYAGTIVVRSR